VSDASGCSAVSYVDIDSVIVSLCPMHFGCSAGLIYVDLDSVNVSLCSMHFGCSACLIYVDIDSVIVSLCPMHIFVLLASYVNTDFILLVSVRSISEDCW